ncbi:hypothetical protein JCM11641_001278 [Rhodosporidiobolus odoratus]
MKRRITTGTALKNTGFHEDDLATLSFAPVVPLTFTARIDYEKFDKEAHDEWSKISSRRRSNAAQLKSLTKKTGNISLTSRGSASSSSTTRSSGTRTPTVTVTAANSPGTTAGASCPTKLTDHERNWLSATKGCFKCRKSFVDHESADCTAWAPNGWVVPISTGWKRGNAVPPSPPVSGIGGVRAVHTVEDEEEIELPESLAYGSDTSDEVEGYAFPPLSLTVGSGSRGRSALALTDSGSSFSLISDKLVRELGLERVKLKDPFDIILGVPFLRQHRIILALHPKPQIMVERKEGEPLDRTGRRKRAKLSRVGGRGSGLQPRLGQPSATSIPPRRPPPSAAAYGLSPDRWLPSSPAFGLTFPTLPTPCTVQGSTPPAFASAATRKPASISSSLALSTPPNALLSSPPSLPGTSPPSAPSFLQKPSSQRF